MVENIELRLQYLGVNSTGTKLYLNDGTGLYEPSSNPGGYGGANPERSDVVLVLQAKHKKTTGAVDMDISIYDPETVEVFEIDVPKDGYYNFASAVFIKSATPTVGGYSYFDKAFYKNVGGVISLTSFEEILEDTTFDNRIDLDVVSTAKIELAKNKAMLLYIEALKKNNQDRDHYREIVARREAYNYIRALFEGMKIHWEVKNFMGAQELIEALEDYIEY